MVGSRGKIDRVMLVVFVLGLILVCQYTGMAQASSACVSVKIMNPTTESTYCSTYPCIKIDGVCNTSDGSANITQVKWECANGDSGNCSLDYGRFSAAVTLKAGDNLIKITACDSNSNAGCATIRVKCTLPCMSYNVIDLCEKPKTGFFKMTDSGYICGNLPDSKGNTQAVQWYTGKDMVWLGTLGGRNSYACDINNLGHVVGHSNSKDGSLNTFLWRDGNMREITGFGAIKLNDNDQILGCSSIWDNGTIKPFNTNGFDMLDIVDFNNKCTVVGCGTIFNGEMGFEEDDIVLINGDSQQRIRVSGQANTGWFAAMNNNNQICGADGCEGPNMALKIGGSSLQLPDEYLYSSAATDINDAGQVTGYMSGESMQHAVFWDVDGSMTDMGTLGGERGWPSHIGPCGQVLGLSETYSGNAEPFIWDKSNGIRPLNSLIDNSMGWQIQYGQGIDSMGRILACGLDKFAKEHELLLCPLGPKVEGLNPNSGQLSIGRTYNLATTFSDPNGCQDIQYCYLLISPNGRLTDAVYLLYDAGTGKLWVRSSDNQRWIGGYYAGRSATAENSACILKCSSAKVCRDINRLTITWPIQLKSILAGKKCTAWMFVRSYSDQRDGFKQVGCFDMSR